MRPALELRGAAVDRAGRAIVRDIDVDVAEASWFGLIGANGSGKTTLLRALAGRMAFSAGSCILDGVDLAGDRMARAARFGFAPPADRLPDALRVRDLFELAGGDVDAVRERLGPVRAALGIDRLVDRWVGDCSAGMRQRAAVALGLAGGQRLVVLDEPFNWLDPVAAYDLRCALRALVDGGLTLIAALHDLGTLATACDTGLMLADGRVALAIDRPMLDQAREAPHRFEQRMIDVLRSKSDP
ncbi:MAG: ATP-binding cassette domain-containing protein [Pseudomonadota bacterium]